MYYYPIITIVPTYFDRHRGFAMGVVLAGSGLGGLVMALVLQYLLDMYGIVWALKILGFWNFGIGVVVALIVEERDLAGRRRGSILPNKSLMKRGIFWYQVCARHGEPLKTN